MRNILENLLTAAEKVKKPSPKLKQAITAADKKLHELDSREELKKLGQALKDANPKTFITFNEDHDPENRYAIVVNTKEDGLLRKLAKIFGCLEEELPEDDAVEFEAGDHWHGRGEINLRTIADELIQIHGPFFSSVFTVEELQRFARD